MGEAGTGSGRGGRGIVLGDGWVDDLLFPFFEACFACRVGVSGGIEPLQHRDLTLFEQLNLWGKSSN